eukprot:scaffold17477_cov103-Isochrysis_galbana.AAC.3
MRCTHRRPKFHSHMAAAVAFATFAACWLEAPLSRPATLLLSRRAVSARSGVLRMADSPEAFDYLVIGGGSGGMASARRAATHGAKTCVIERARLGGTCVNVGCVPKKVMFNAASVLEILHQAEGYGITVGEAKFDMKAIKAKRDAYVKRLNGIYLNNLNNNGITFVAGDAKFVGPKVVEVDGKAYTAKHILIAVGGKPAVPDIPGAKELGITSDGFFELEEVPERVAVVGSGYIAVELAGILNVLGSKVQNQVPTRTTTQAAQTSRRAGKAGTGFTPLHDISPGLRRYS